MPSPSHAYWDRDVDSEGRPIRADVRRAAQEVWGKARKLSESILGDSTEAAEILESCVARVSRYMDERGQKLFSQQTPALLLVAFRNALRSFAQKRRRMQSLGDLTGSGAEPTCEPEIEPQLELANLVRRLSARNRVILTLRTAGYDWREVASAVGISVSNAKSGFWREIKKLRSNVGKRHAKPVMGPASQESSSSNSSDSSAEPSSSTVDITLMFICRSPPEELSEQVA